jgi:5'-3' exonuclease
MGKKFIEAKNLSNFENLLIVDGLNLAFRYKYSNTKDYAAKYMATVQSLANSYEAKQVIVLGDGGSLYREKIDPEYKGNRKELRAKQTEQEAADFKEFLEEFDRTLELIDTTYETLKFRGVEADDIAAYIAKYYAADFEHTWLISSDKDWDLLIADNVSRFSYVSRKEVTLHSWPDFYDYNPEDHISIKVIMGDKGDNVPGVEGIGIKRACALIKQYSTAYDIYASIPVPGSQKFIQNLNKFKEKILTNYELMDLMTYCDAAILDNKDEISEVMDG